MKNIGASVGAVSTQVKKEEVEKVVEKGKKYIRKENEVIFCLEEAPEFQISAVARWGENALGEIMEQPDIYFRHISTGRLCQSVYACMVGVEHDQYAEEKSGIPYTIVSALCCCATFGGLSVMKKNMKYTQYKNKNNINKT